MSSLAEHTDLSWLQTVDKCLITRSTVRIEDIPRFLIALTHDLTDLSIAIRSTADEVGDAVMRSLGSQLVILTIKIDDSGEVRGIAHIHCIG